jgi:hypothetical protein
MNKKNMCDCEKLGEKLMQGGSEVPAKRNDPNYMQIAGDVKKDLGLRFKALCTFRQLSLGEGLEEAISIWLENQPASTSNVLEDKK